MGKGNSILTRGTQIACPHCGGATYVRSSTQITALARESRHMCLNDQCCHVFAVQSEIVRTIQPSLCPDPAIELRVVNQNLRAQRVRPSNDNHPRPANDEGPAIARSPGLT
ncbi:MAG: ogr/Delta-like zinc finger family protein [Sphingobium sp.]